MGIKFAFFLFFLVFSTSLAADVCNQTCDSSCYACEPIQMDAEADIEKTVLDYGESTNISVKAVNAEPNVTIECQYAVDYGDASGWFEIPNDGNFSEMGKEIITAPTEEIGYQVYEEVRTRIYCRANITNETDTLWCGGGCIELVDNYVYPSLGSISEYQSKKLEASSRLFEARKLAEEAMTMILKARSILDSTTGNIEAAKFYLTLAEEQYATATQIYEEASYAYDLDDFDNSISLSLQAKILSESSKQNAFLSYNSITYPSAVYYYVWSYINDSQQGSDETGGIIDTINKIISGPGGGGVPPSVKAALEDALGDIDKANALLDEANRRLLEGDFSAAQRLAEEARRLVEEAQRKLRRIFLDLLNSLTNSLLDLYDQIAGRLGLMIDPIEAIMRVHGAEEWEVAAVTANLQGAQRSLDRAYSLIRNMKNSEDIATLSRRGEIADAAMRDSISQMDSALAQIQNVLFRTYLKVAAVAIIAAILTSFVWHHRKKLEAPKKEVRLASIVSRAKLEGRKQKKLADLFQKR